MARQKAEDLGSGRGAVTFNGETTDEAKIFISGLTRGDEPWSVK
jgi:hypothetical protein